MNLFAHIFWYSYLKQCLGIEVVQVHFWHYIFKSCCNIFHMYSQFSIIIHQYINQIGLQYKSYLDLDNYYKINLREILKGDCEQLFPLSTVNSKVSQSASS